MKFKIHLDKSFLCAKILKMGEIMNFGEKVILTSVAVAIAITATSCSPDKNNKLETNNTQFEQIYDEETLSI